MVLFFFILAFQISLFVDIFAQTTNKSKQVRIFPDEYSELDDVPISSKNDDPFILKTLERARVRYLRGLSFIEKNDTVRAAENFEMAIDILNSISSYPNINSNKDYTELIQAILEDYEKYIQNIDKLNENSSLYILREALTKELDLAYKSSKIKMSTIQQVKSDTTYKTSAKSTYTIPMDDNEYVKRSIEFLTQKPIGRKFVRTSLARSTLWGNLIKQIILEEEMPLELFYLAMVESGFNPFAVSRAKAVGIWQFISSTGQLYNLNSNGIPWIDERRDPIKSTRAAMRHLKDLFNELGDWHLAIAAYNCGINCVRKAIERLNQPDQVNFWNVMPFLPRETRNYVPLFIATVKVVENLEEYGFNKSEMEFLPEIKFDKYVLNEPVSLSAIAKCANTTVERIKEYNPELLFSFTPSIPSGYEIRIPYGTRQIFLANYLNLTPEEKQPVFTYRVERKETISSIAEKFNLNPNELLLVNNLASTSKKLPVGTKLKIPIVAYNSTTEENQISTPETQMSKINDSKKDSQTNKFTSEYQSNPAFEFKENRTTVRYIVKENETLEYVALKFKIPADSLIVWNELKSPRIREGQILRIFVDDMSESTKISNRADDRLGNVSTNGTSQNSFTNLERNVTDDKTNSPNLNQPVFSHIVRRGETLEEIAKRYKVDVEMILEANPRLRNRKDNILAGERIEIPGKATSATTSSPKQSKKERARDTKGKYHLVRKGDTLSDIATKYGLTFSEIKALNPKINPNRLKVGQKIKIQ
ncbi:MAG: LysM peptidoglycan-binding domain-containing protein [Ignavibacteria bacterium]|nr:LysM peptidoglycan-binding domain-containing protein [Ignavibacteria bacterium]